MDTARNAPTALPVPARRALGSMLLGGTMWLAGLLALWRAVWSVLW